MSTPLAGGYADLPRGVAALVPVEPTAQHRLGMQVPARAGWFIPR
jgi:hypothetical protein